VIFSWEEIAVSHSELVGHHDYKTFAVLWTITRVWTTSTVSIGQRSCDLSRKKNRILVHFKVQVLSNVRNSCQTAVDFSSSATVLDCSTSLGDLRSFCLHLTRGSRSYSWLIYYSFYLTSQSTQHMDWNNTSAVGPVVNADEFIAGRPLFLMLVKIVFWYCYVILRAPSTRSIGTLIFRIVDRKYDLVVSKANYIVRNVYNLSFGSFWFKWCGVPDFDDSRTHGTFDNRANIEQDNGMPKLIQQSRVRNEWNMLETMFAQTLSLAYSTRRKWRKTTDFTLGNTGILLKTIPVSDIPFNFGRECLAHFLSLPSIFHKSSQHLSDTFTCFV